MFWTTLLVLACVLPYLLLQRSLYLPPENAELFALSIPSKPLGTLTYAFVHVGPAHLIFNTVCLAFFAKNLERLVKSEILGIFFFSAIFGGLAYCLFNPGTFLVGSSAGVFGLLGASLLVSPRRTAVSLFLCTLILILVADKAVITLEKAYVQFLAKEKTKRLLQILQLQKEVEQLQRMLSSMGKELKVLEKRLKEAEKIYGPESAVVAKLRQELEQKVSKKEEKEKELEQKKILTKAAKEAFAEVLKAKQYYQSGKSMAENAPVALVSHFCGVFAGIFYLYLRRREFVLRRLKLAWGVK